MKKDESIQSLQSIEKEEINQTLQKLIQIHEQISSAPQNYSVEEKAGFYRSFGEILFNLSQYKRAIELFKVAQEIEFSEEIDHLIQQAFIQPNLLDFEENYNKSSSQLKSKEAAVSFSDLPYFLIPTERSDQFYLYHKKTRRIGDIFTLFQQDESRERIWNKVDLASGLLLIDQYEIGNSLAEIKSIGNIEKENYIIFKEYNKFLSTLQGGVLEGLESITIFSSYLEFKVHFESNSAFLPRNVIDYCDGGEKAESYLSHLHRYRLRPQNKVSENVVLSICIPSFNRGHRALENVINVLNSHYDYEIEVVVSNNGTRNITAPYYKEIKEYEDSRVTYFEFKENQGFYANVVNVCKMASGKFVLLISDEDLIDIEVLEKILAFLMAEPNIAVLKTSTTIQSQFDTLQAAAGEEALRKFMLTSNYMSGMILNNKLFQENKVFERVDELYVKGNLTAAVYPHTCWETIMFQYGDVHCTSLRFVHEGVPEKMEEEYIITHKKSVEVPAYATVESRLEQHQGFLDIMAIMEISSNEKVMEMMYISLCHKTFWLMRVSIENYYRHFSSQKDLEKIIEDTRHFCKESLKNVAVKKSGRMLENAEKIYGMYFNWISGKN